MRKIFFLIFIILLGIPAVWPFLQKGFFWTHDIIYLTRIYAASNALSDGQFPLRWIQDFRYGEPLFNYYAPLPYYLGAAIHFLGFNFITTAKIIFILITLLSGLGMYLLTREYWGNWGSILSALLYLYAPYRALNLYIRGAFSESFAFVWFPLIFWAYHKFFKTTQKKYLILGSVFLALLIFTHNIMALIFLPFVCAFLVFEIYSTQKLSSLINVFNSIVLGLGLSATFWLPAFLEKQFVQTEKAMLPLDNFVNQFVRTEEFFKPTWNGFVISHEIGIIHLALTVLAILSCLVLFKKQRKLSLFIFFGLWLLFISLWMQTIQSLNLWLFITPLQFIQFPWRFAGISIFLIALLGGSSVQLIKSRRLKLAVVAFTIAATLFLQSNYFKPQNLNSNATDKDFIILEDVYLPKEYIPIGVKADPPQKINSPVLADGYQEIPTTNLIKHSNSYAFDIELKQPQDVVVPVYWFPGWKAFSQKQEIILKKQPKTGLILLSLPAGKQEIILRLTDTTLRQIGNLISLFSLVGISFWFISGFRKNSMA